MKKSTKVLAIGSTVAILTSVIRWNYVVTFLELSVGAAASVVESGNVDSAFLQEVNGLSVEKFIDITFFNQWMEENNEREFLQDDNDE